MMRVVRMVGWKDGIDKVVHRMKIDLTGDGWTSIRLVTSKKGEILNEAVFHANVRQLRLLSQVLEEVANMLEEG